MVFFKKEEKNIYTTFSSEVLFHIAPYSESGSSKTYSYNGSNYKAVSSF